MKKIYIDLETTGLHPKENGVTQLAGIIEIDGEVKEKFNIFSRPFAADVITQEALDVTKKTKDEVLAYQSARIAYGQLVNILERYVSRYDRKDKFLFIGYNSRFDMDMLRGFFEKNGDQYIGSWFFFPPLDIMNLAIYFLSDQRHKLKDFKLGTIADHFGLTISTMDNLHDALVDIEITMQIEKKIIELQRQNFLL